MHSLLSGDGGWQARDADIEKKSAMTDPYGQDRI